MFRAQTHVSCDLLSLFSGNGRRIVAVIEAYIDESQKPLLGRQLYAVSGFFGTHEQWQRFGEIWQSVLDATEIAYYHGKDPKCDKLRAPMISAIRASGIQGLTASLWRDEFAKGGHALKSVIGNHYAFQALWMALTIRTWAKQNGHGPIAYILEDGQPNIEHVLRMIRTEIGADAAAVACAGKRDFIGLQAADFLAHHTAAMDVGLAWVTQLLGEGPGCVKWGNLDPKDLDVLSRKMEDHQRQRRRHKSQAKRERRAAKARGGG